MKDSYIIAVDGGGSKCQTRLYKHQHHNFLAEHIGGACNFASNFAQATTNLIQSIEKLLHKANFAELSISQCVVVGGFAGVNLPKVCQQLSNWQHPFKEFLFTTDLHLACYAANQSSTGKAIITGTGSCAIATNDHSEVVFGGYGFQLGDQASGAWLGRQAIEHTLLELDNLATASQVSKQVTRYSQTSDATQLSQQWYLASPKQFAQLSHIIIELTQQQDPTAMVITQTAVSYLARIVMQLNQIQDGPIYLLGGLAEFYKRQLQQQYPVSLSDHQPIDGALVLLQNPKLSLNETNA
ncbi:BadF/BadG/BcrA/BcrD type ATPase [Catenovulum agarivorans DS-2]|uniref:BadF/BadG/BcrA/BcrD type ATPase n=1 Tax=Catenovulum agarivorans DS-2 TaxID=1328313 RepID=W7QZ52_9ALTE|nr:BadF/BadG/BcrA/BcrD ATPase family protein [Catenovulum agarivorans]EWH10630.1 BadF/BadG/BcrA/BcrD type ATPase [Catenovulum agarivorans DS-2]